MKPYVFGEPGRRLRELDAAINKRLIALKNLKEQHCRLTRAMRQFKK